mmetsp:Transcript_16444/g.32158  ORF Transcript_16444/g.32158 Transcript_16444/m.32158 type:complete len:171 (+) Transcript_16444:12-524(+)
MASSVMFWGLRRLKSRVLHYVCSRQWETLYDSYGSRFQDIEDFLSGSKQAYKYMQNELCTADNVGHLKTMVSEKLYEAILLSLDEREEWRMENGGKGGWIFDDVEAYVEQINAPESFEEKASFTADVSFLSAVRLEAQPEEVMFRADGFVFETQWDPEQGIGEWKISSIY